MNSGRLKINIVRIPWSSNIYQQTIPHIYTYIDDIFVLGELFRMHLNHVSHKVSCACICVQSEW